ncbi:hypothetical protein [Aeoliella mucimassa]|uniref:Uncharacterized protein n=1 Tax=Aeoliella mucimassa TaxID=2527972 RepID=A0A518AT06_9BACT|nr:hypothetical protein [Aeoliella mucimassa]QDU57817.1 hypothetical protein Pan181_40400 [Aeoliella mucimassa]
MVHEDAKIELARHAGIVNEYYEDGFIGCLRPYSGIRVDNFHSVVESLLSVGVDFAPATTIECCTTEAVYRITVTARRWGVDDDGMLVRSNLISPDDRRQLLRWITIIETMMLDLLAGHQPHETIHGYCEYVAECGWGENAAFFVPLLGSAIETDEFGDRLQVHCAAVTRLGAKAIAIYDSLVLARQRKWEWYEPHEQCAAEMLGYIDRALASIGTTQT